MLFSDLGRLANAGVLPAGGGASRSRANEPVGRTSAVQVNVRKGRL